MTSMMTIPVLPMRQGIWTIDDAHTTVAFAVRHLGLSKVRGRFERVVGRLQVGTDLATTSVQATIAVDSLTTGNAERDLHLASNDFLHRSSHPEIAFKSTAIGGDGNDQRFVMTGELTIKGTTRSIDLEVEFFGTSLSPVDGSERAGFSAVGSISRRSFGIDFNVPMGGDKVLIADHVHIELDVELVRSEQAGPTDAR